MREKKLLVIAHIHSLKFAYAYGQADTMSEAQTMISNFFGRKPDPNIVTVEIVANPEHSKQDLSEKQEDYAEDYEEDVEEEEWDNMVDNATRIDHFAG